MRIDLGGRVLVLACAAVAAASGAQAVAATPTSKNVTGSAGAFADTIGAGVATFYDDTATDDKPRMKAHLQDMGLKHLRGGIRNGRRAYEYAAARDLAANGMKFMWITGRPGSPIDPNGWLEVQNVLTDPNKLAGTTEALEGPNEYDISGYSNWEQRLYDYMRETYAGSKADPSFTTLPHFGPSFVHNDNRERWVRQLAAERLMDAPNAHIYPGGNPPEVHIEQQAKDVAKDHRDENRMPVLSEIGYHNAINNGNSGHFGVSERAQSIYLLRTFLTAFAAKIPRTYIYTFMDLFPEPAKTDMEMHFGLVAVEGDRSADKSTWTTRPKQAFYSIKELLEITRDSGLVPGPGSLSYALTGAPGDLRQVLLSRSDGSVDLVLWNPASVYKKPTWSCTDPRVPSPPPPEGACEYAKYHLAVDQGDEYPADIPVTLDLAQPATVWTERPHSERDFTLRGWGKRFTIDVGADPVFVRISPSKYAAAVKADNPTAYLRLDEGSGTATDSAGLGAAPQSWTAAPTYGRPGAVGDSNPAVRVTGTQRATVRLPAPVSNATGATMEVWVKPDPVSPDFREFARAEDSPSPWRVRMRTYNTHDGATWGSVYGATEAGEMIFRGLDDDRWHHLVLTMLGGGSTTYLDGKKVGETSGASPMTFSAFTVGARDGFVGDLDEFAVYPRVLTAGQVCAHYRAAGGSC
jgi:hypothetical protein